MIENPENLDSLFREAVSAVDAVDVSALERLLTAHPRLVHDRLEAPGPWLRAMVGGAVEGYFRRPYLLWFAAENLVRNGRLPGNVVQVARTILEAAKRLGVDSLQEQTDYALELVCTGRVARECGAQRDLIDVLIEAGAHPDGPLVATLAHGERAAAERLLARGARMTLLAAVCTGRTDDVARLARAARTGSSRWPAPPSTVGPTPSPC